MDTIKMSNETSNKTSKAGVFAAIAIVAALTIPSAVAAQSVHDEDRCEAYFTLASCDRDDCLDENAVQYEGDETRLELSEDRCNVKFKRALRKPNAKYACGFDTCQIDVIDDKLTAVEESFLVCEAKNEIMELGPEHLQGCYDRCSNQLSRLQALAYVNHCSTNPEFVEQVEIPETCEVF